MKPKRKRIIVPPSPIGKYRKSEDELMDEAVKKMNNRTEMKLLYGGEECYIDKAEEDAMKSNPFHPSFDPNYNIKTGETKTGFGEKELRDILTPKHRFPLSETIKEITNQPKNK